MFQLHEDIWWANAQLWNDWRYLMSQCSYSSLKRLTIFVGTCLESLNLGGEGRDQTISKDCSPHLSFVLSKGDRRCKIKELNNLLLAVCLDLYLLSQIFQIKTLRFLVMSLSHPSSWICCSNLVGHSLWILSNVRLSVFFCKYSSKIKIKEKLCLSDTSLGQSRKSLLTKICHFSIKYDVVALF